MYFWNQFRHVYINRNESQIVIKIFFLLFFFFFSYFDSFIILGSPAPPNHRLNTWFGIWPHPYPQNGWVSGWVRASLVMSMGCWMLGGYPVFVHWCHRRQHLQSGLGRSSSGVAAIGSARLLARWGFWSSLSKSWTEPWGRRETLIWPILFP